MPKRKPGLGRGLAELLGESGDQALGPGEAATGEDRSGGAPSAGDMRDVPVTAIRPNPRQPRRTMDREALEELAASIRTSGVVQPIIVRSRDEGYELIAGERRWRAAQIAGYTVVPAILREASDTESLELSLVENVARQQLNPVDEALALHMLMEDLGATQEGLSSRVGKSRSAIANKIRLLELPSEVQDFLAEGRLSEGHGRALLGVESRGDLLRLARRAVAEGMSVRAVEAAVRRMNEPAKPRAQTPRPDAELVERATERFHEVLEVVPRVRMTSSGGRVEIPFEDEAELRRILDRLGS